MARTIHNESIQKNRDPGCAFGSLDSDALKNMVRDELMSMITTDREVFVQTLEREMVRDNFSMRSYLIPLGIPARTPDELTPTEIGHLVRFLRIIVPRAMPAVERAMALFPAFAEHRDPSAVRLAA